VATVAQEPELWFAPLRDRSGDEFDYAPDHVGGRADRGFALASFRDGEPVDHREHEIAHHAAAHDFHEACRIVR
jgi:hypothetical protein